MGDSTHQIPVEPDVLLIFIGYTADAEDQATVIYNLEHKLQKELDQARAINQSVSYRRVKCWKWKDDSSNKAGGQHKNIDPFIERANIDVFIFRDRIGDGAWYELEKCRKVQPPKSVIVFFPNAPSDLSRLSDAEYLGHWTKLVNRKDKLCADFNSENSFSVKPQKAYSDNIQLEEMAFKQIKASMVELLSQPPPPPPQKKESPTRYLNWLEEECGSIDIRGLMVSGGSAPRFDIEELYIPLQIAGQADDGKRGKKGFEAFTEKRISLDTVMRQRQAVVIGDPGMGKTTFLRRIAAIICRNMLGKSTATSLASLGLKNDVLPIFIRLADLASHVAKHNGKPDTPNLATSPAWIYHFLDSISEEREWELAGEFFKERCRDGKAVFLLDGLDEPPGKERRAEIVKLIEEVVKAYGDCAYFVTTRPASYTGTGVLQQNFRSCTISPLEDEGISTFLSHWSGALHQGDARKASELCEELKDALRARPEVKRMAVNPVMLTALAVIYWNDRRLPEQRADLYESILTWLIRARLQRSRYREIEYWNIYQALAFAMQIHPKERKQMELGRTCDAIEPLMEEKTPRKMREAARAFMREEAIYSGIIVARGTTIEFWHLTFQEYLAARELGGMSDTEQKERLIHRDVLHNPDWREVILLFSGVLCKQGPSKMDNFFKAMFDLEEGELKGLPQNKALSIEARCFGLVGLMLRDLSPYKYKLTDSRYISMSERVLAIFEKGKAETIDVKVRLSAADALGQAGDPRLWEDLRDSKAKRKMFVHIPAGEFLMGAQKTDSKKPGYDDEAFDRESPVHKIFLSAYAIGKYPVTVAQYNRFMEENGYTKEEYWQAGGYGEWKSPDKWDVQQIYPNRPVVGVSWFEAKAFCVWAGLRLLSEVEWERAARGPGIACRKYPWGGEEPDENQMNYDKTGNGDYVIGHASPVGLFPSGASHEGIYDLSGNVYEWCEDWYDENYYKKSSYKNSKGPTSGSGRVIRGGSWYDGSGDCRAAYRNSFDPEFRFDLLGFRCASPRGHQEQAPSGAEKQSGAGSEPRTR